MTVLERLTLRLTGDLYGRLFDTDGQARVTEREFANLVREALERHVVNSPGTDRMLLRAVAPVDSRIGAPKCGLGEKS